MVGSAVGGWLVVVNMGVREVDCESSVLCGIIHNIILDDGL